jgi:epoxyqueuosine reductase
MAQCNDFLECVRKKGYKVSSMSTSHLDEVREDVERFRRDGSLSNEIYDEYLFRFKYCIPESFPDAKSIIVASVPQPVCEITFNWEGRRIRTIIPPTYAKAVDVDMEIVSMLERCDGNGVHLMRAILPHKTLAARTGLVRYGRNNITYVPEFGSYHRLTSFFTNRELPDNWQNVEVMERCADCSACARKCPTKAISDDRFLVHAERCLTLHNERPNETPFPEFVSPEMHNAIIGCMVCQKVCPANAEAKKRMVSCAELSEEETEFLMRGDRTGPMAKSVAARLEPLGLEVDLFPRNLQVLLDQQR